MDYVYGVLVFLLFFIFMMPTDAVYDNVGLFFMVANIVSFVAIVAPIFEVVRKGLLKRHGAQKIAGIIALVFSSVALVACILTTTAFIMSIGTDCDRCWGFLGIIFGALGIIGAGIFSLIGTFIAWIVYKCGKKDS